MVLFPRSSVIGDIFPCFLGVGINLAFYGDRRSKGGKVAQEVSAVLSLSISTPTRRFSDPAAAPLRSLEPLRPKTPSCKSSSRLGRCVCAVHTGVFSLVNPGTHIYPETHRNMLTINAFCFWTRKTVRIFAPTKRVFCLTII